MEIEITTSFSRLLERLPERRQNVAFHQRSPHSIGTIDEPGPANRAKIGSARESG